MLVKIWKPTVWPTFIGAYFFSNVNIQILELWKPVVQNILETDSSSIDEILLHLVPLSSTANMNIFQSKDADIINKKQYLRRLSFCIYSCPMDYFFILLPLIHERIVELLKSKSVGVQTQVLYVIQFLVFKLSPNHITNLWPIIITELIRIIDNCILLFPIDLEERNLLLSCFRLLYIVQSLKLDEFQCHRWIFFDETSKADGSGMKPLFSRLMADFPKPLDPLTKIEDVDRRGILLEPNGLKNYAHYLNFHSGNLDKLGKTTKIDFMDQVFIDRE